MHVLLRGAQSGTSLAPPAPPAEFADRLSVVNLWSPSGPQKTRA
jgi:hypothetical protein